LPRYSNHVADRPWSPSLFFSSPSPFSQKKKARRPAWPPPATGNVDQPSPSSPFFLPSLLCCCCLFWIGDCPIMSMKRWFHVFSGIAGQSLPPGCSPGSFGLCVGSFFFFSFSSFSLQRDWRAGANAYSPPPLPRYAVSRYMEKRRTLSHPSHATVRATAVFSKTVGHSGSWPDIFQLLPPPTFFSEGGPLAGPQAQAHAEPLPLGFTGGSFSCCIRKEGSGPVSRGKKSFGGSPFSCTEDELALCLRAF